MMLECFALRDVKAGAYGRPFFCQNKEVATRDVASFVSQGDSVVARFPGDFRVYLLGVFDDASGVFRPLQIPEFVCEVSSLVVKPVEVIKEVVNA